MQFPVCSLYASYTSLSKSHFASNADHVIAGQKPFPRWIHLIDHFDEVVVSSIVLPKNLRSHTLQVFQYNHSLSSFVEHLKNANGALSLNVQFDCQLLQRVSAASTRLNDFQVNVRQIQFTCKSFLNRQTHGIRSMTAI